MSDALRDREPTTHEVMSGQPWDASYSDGLAPWDVEHPQGAIVRLADTGAFRGRVLDAGCGSGDNGLYLASLGLAVVGVDVAETALARAREKAAARSLSAEFIAGDAFQLERLGRTFDTVVDCGLFHAFDDNERARYAASLAAVTSAGATVYVLCFSDDSPETGPHPVSPDQLRGAFTEGAGWRVTRVEPERVETRFHDNGAPAWLATIERI